MLACVPGSVISIPPLTSHAKLTLLEYVPSFARIVGKYHRPEAPSASVPVITPVLALMLSPGGNPSAAQPSVPLLMSLAVIDNEMVAFSPLVWSSGAVMVTGPVIVHRKLCAAEYVPSLASTVTVYEPAVPGS